MIFDIQKFCLHDGLGIRTTVFFKGCNLRCKWCANPESWSSDTESMDGRIIGKAYTIDALLDELVKDKAFYDKSGGGVTLSGGEPLLQADFVCELCDRLDSLGINVAIETAACVDTQLFSRVIQKLSYLHVDLKHWNAEKYRQGTGADIRKSLENLKIAISGKTPVIIRIPVIPGYNDSSEDAKEFVKLIKGLGAKKVHILPFHQLGEKKYAQLNREYQYTGVPGINEDGLHDFIQIFKEALFDVQIGG